MRAVTPPATVTAYIALGANIGDREGNLRAAVRELGATRNSRVIRVSSFFENPAVGGPPDSPPFLNAVAEIETALPPRELLDRLLEIEKLLGRVRRDKWEPRLIDLDLLLYGDAVLDTPTLKIPHPLMQRRHFVLQPLVEIAPDAMHPTLRQTVRQLLLKLGD